MIKKLSIMITALLIGTVLFSQEIKTETVYKFRLVSAIKSVRNENFKPNKIIETNVINTNVISTYHIKTITVNHENGWYISINDGVFIKAEQDIHCMDGMCLSLVTPDNKRLSISGDSVVFGLKNKIEVIEYLDLESSDTKFVYITAVYKKVVE
jgi:hypothetical protein